MTDADRQFLFDLLSTPSPTGWEAPGQRLWAARASGDADRVESDAYGSAWAVRDGKSKKAPTLLLEAHADEIGFAVKYITEDGFLRVDRIGGSDQAIARGRRLMVLGENGPVPAIIGNTAIHLRDRKDDEKAPKLEELFVDVGAKDREGVAALGIRVGHPAVYPDGPSMLGDDLIMGRALDNRLGGYVLTQVLDALASGAKHSATVVALNAVQEEIGGNGAKMAAYRIDPDMAVVLDVTHATDSPGIEKAKHGEVKLGGGPTVTHGTVNHPEVVARLMEVAEQEGIPLQHESSSRYSGTDTDVIFTSRRGVPSALVSIPMRYMHSTVETVAVSDVEHTVRLLTAFAQSIRTSDTFRTEIL
ncbi:M42 family metallopeptidase [Rubricoccus marinus]|uniref:Endoglucanase n=1 Tax=Rubricoccus marinus TaxID=716817 RepID=A0A259TY93_9BACT|nr:M42 family metallopeptidase [Rubricoccus marinus]OZC02660.1 endoglucanase [Rubricoccus marinus]